MDALVGRAVGNYVVTRQIGQGGMGAVYLAEHRTLGRRVAVKVLLPAAGANPELVRRFFHEAKAATEIRSPHIVDVLDFGQLDDGTSYLVMEWLEGRTLAAALRSDGPFAPARAARVVRQIAKALSAAHARGIVHRDLKPDNVFLTAVDEDPEFVKVLDFGIAKLTGAVDVRTQTGALLGTPYYMAPEQCEGRPVDARADVYALGVIAYELLAGRPPFAGKTLTEIIVGHLSTPPPSLRARVPGLPAALEAAVMQALAKSADERFARVDAFAAAFASAVEEQPAVAVGSTPTPMPTPTVTPAPTPTPTPTPTSRDPRALRIPILIGAVVVAAAVVGGVIAAVPKPAVEPPHESPPAVVPAAVVPSPSPSPSPSASDAVRPSRPARPAKSAAPSSTTSAVERWSLERTTCAPGAMPRTIYVTTRPDGSAHLANREGLPAADAVVGEDGTFVARNAFGTCVGRTDGRVTTQTCTSMLGVSCASTYRRRD